MAASGTSGAHASAVHPRSRPIRTAMAPRIPATSPPTTPKPISSSTSRTGSVSAPPSADANANAMSNSGTQSPSFSPLSTFSPCRIRDGTRSSDTTVWPSAASVGATAMARRAASTTLRPGSTRSADPMPARIVRGRPMPRSRAGTASSRVSAPRLIFDASENRTSASVVSAIRRSTALLGLDREPSEHGVAEEDAGAEEEDRGREDGSPKASRARPRRACRPRRGS